MRARVLAVARDDLHRFAKTPRASIELLAGLGVAGDAHCGRAVQHLSRIAKTPGADNLRQVHLIHRELFDELAAAGFAVAPGALGENVTTEGIDLLSLSRGTRLRLGSAALIEVTGLRNPCRQIDKHIGRGAMAATLETRSDASLARKAGVMAVVVAGGRVTAGDAIECVLQPGDYIPLEPV